MDYLDYIYKKKFILFFALSFLLYGNTLKNGYGIDDQFVTENNYTNKGLKSVKRIFTSYYAENDGKNNYEYRPIVKISFAIEHQLFGVKPWIGHLINIILYALCLTLLLKVLKSIFYKYPESFSLTATIIFAFIPVHSEVVASLKNRDILICFIFCMYIFFHLESFFKTGKYRFLFYTLIFSALSFLTKFDVLPFFVIIPLILYKKYKTKIIPIALSLSVFTIGFFIFRFLKRSLLDKSISDRIFKYHENPLFFNESWELKLSTAFNSLGFYLKMLVFPNKMVCYYGYNTIDSSNFFSLYSILGILLSIIMIYYFFKLFKTENPLWYVIVFFGIGITMYLNIVRVVPGIVADRFLFFSSIGFAILIGYLLLFFINKNTHVVSLQKTNSGFKIISLLLLVLYSFSIISRNEEWKDRVTLYGSDIKKMPSSVALNLLYSNEILVNLKNPTFFKDDNIKNQNINTATLCLNNVLKIDSLNTTALNNLAFIKQSAYNDYAGAIPYYQKALAIDSTKFEVQFNLCYCLFKTSNLQLAQNLALKMFMENPTNQQVLDLMSYILIENKKINEGILIYTKLIEEQPDNNNLNIILGNFHISNLDSVNAKQYFQKALQNDPNNHQLIEIVSKLSK